ncbi:MAG: TonB-dependent receptor, partial [Burkholderiales bacterium]|nr:TonB-dependent receptor [Burkholderiales bacterium]
AKLGYTAQPSELYGNKATYRAWAASASVGSREGAWSWWLNVNHTDSDGQPLTFATRLAATATTGAVGTPVTGAVAGLNNANQAWTLIGSGTQYNTQQDHLKIKLAYEINPTVRASYVFGAWRNDSDGNSASWLRDAAGNPVYKGATDPATKKEFILIDGKQFAGPTGGDFALTREKLLHVMHGISVKSHAGGEWDWELAASLYDYQKDDKRQNAATNPQPGAWTGGAGTLADGSGTGWNTLAVKGIWRPAGTAHVVDLGVQQDSYKFSYLTSSRQAFDGRTDFSATGTPPSIAYPSRSENFLSPKAALSWQATVETVLKASVGRAVRMPTVSELYGATSTTNSQYINDPNLRPEKSWTTELSAEQGWGALQSRVTLFAETTHDSLYSQSILDPVLNKNVSRVQNIDKIGTTGLEATLGATDW